MKSVTKSKRKPATHRRRSILLSKVSNSLYAWETKELKTYAGGRIVSALEGGYNLSSLATSAIAHVKALKEA
jgi:acetoin utilization deacetylase AcuC-like enzyme